MTATNTSSPTTAPTTGPALDFFSVEASASVDSPASAAGAAGSGVVGMGMKSLVAFGLGVVARGVVGMLGFSFCSGAGVWLDAPRGEREEGVLSGGAGGVVAIGGTAVTVGIDTGVVVCGIPVVGVEV
jgi:hypothetical protein